MRTFAQTVWRISIFASLVSAVMIPSGVFAQAVYTGPLVYNTDQPDFGSFPVVETGAWLGAPFKTGDYASLLNSVTIYEKTFFVEGTFGLSVYADNNGVPGTPLAGGMLNGATMPAGFSFQTYSASQPLTLLADTVYWIVASSDNPATHGGGYGWAWAANHNFTSPVGWTLYGYDAFSPDEGATWQSNENVATPMAQLFGISGQVVPEPSALMLLAMSVPVLLTLRGRGRARD